MALGEHVAGLLNLGAMAVVFTLGYLGLDKFDAGRNGIDAGEKQAVEFERKVSHLALQMGITDLDDPNAFGSMSFADRVRFRLLLRIAAVGHWRGKRALADIFAGIWYAPLIGYFRAKLDTALVGVMAFISMLLFLAMSAASAWQIGFVDSDPFAVWSFWVLSSIIILIIVHYLALYRNTKLSDTVPFLIETVNRTLSAQIEEMRKSIREFNLKSRKVDRLD